MSAAGRKGSGKTRARPPARRAPEAPVAVPVPPRRLWSLLIWGGGGLLLAAAAAWSVAIGLHARAATELAAASARAGFAARQVQVVGNRNQDRLSIYAAALDAPTDSLLGLDLGAIRARVEALPWIAAATVSRRWPDTLVVEVTERAPVALWQHQRRYRVIDAAGEVLPVTDPAEMRDLPLVVGAGANREATALLQTLQAHPELARAMRAAILVGERRWDIRLATGETLSLPEGAEAARALKRLAALERETPVRGQGFLRLDLRVPDRLVIRVSPDAQEQARAIARAEARARADAERAGARTGASATLPGAARMGTSASPAAGVSA